MPYLKSITVHTPEQTRTFSAGIDPALEKEIAAHDKQLADLEDAAVNIDCELHTHLVCEHGFGYKFNPATDTTTVGMFKGDTRLLRAPQLDLSKVVNMAEMFYGCTRLKELDLSLPTLNSMSYAFYHCDSIQRINVESAPANAANAFQHCYELEEVTGLDFSRLSTTSYMFFGTPKLSRLPEVIDISKVTNFNGMFQVYTGPGGFTVTDTPINFPDMDFSSAKYASNVFFGRKKVTRWPSVLDFSNSTSLNMTFAFCGDYDTLDMSSIVMPKGKYECRRMFCACYEGIDPDGRCHRKEFPDLDFSQATDLWGIFMGWDEIERAVLDVSSVNSGIGHSSGCGLAFAGCKKLRYLTYKGLGTQPEEIREDLTISTSNNGSSMWGDGNEEARQTIVDSLLTYSFDRKAAGYNTMTIALDRSVFNLLTEEEKAAIVARGYRLMIY